jgi:response regulator of citrate/malate metabolism
MDKILSLIVIYLLNYTTSHSNYFITDWNYGDKGARMISKPSVLIIDDDTEYLTLLTEALEINFEVKVAINLALANRLFIDNIRFDIVLVNEYVGEELGTHWIKEKVGQDNLTTSFVLYTALATEDAILKGLECGADDLLAKPISMLTLTKKLQKLISYQENINRLETTSNKKDIVVQLSLAQASKYGSSIQLSAKLNNCCTLKEIRDEVFAYFYSINLHGCIGFYPINNPCLYYSSSHGYCAPVEIEVMKLLKTKPRVYHFGSRTMFNHPLISILVLNLDQGSVDSDIYIDALTSVIDCIGARMHFINYKDAMVDVQQEIEKSLVFTKKMLQISQHCQQELINEIVNKLTQSSAVFQMDIAQQNYITELVKNTMERHAQENINFTEVEQSLDLAYSKSNDFKRLNEYQCTKLPLTVNEDNAF